MSGKILYGKEVAEAIKAEAKETLSKNGATLTVIIVGEDHASQVYVRNKQKVCEEVGIKSNIIRLPENTDKKTIKGLIDKLNADSMVDGFFIQLPLPKHLASFENELTNCISPEKDVDGLTILNVGQLASGNELFVQFKPCTALGCMYMLEKNNVEIDGKHAVIVGRSNIVGKPMANMLLNKNATVTICHSHTKNLAEITKTADILVVAIGKPKYITADMVKEGAVVIDVGINRTEHGLVGDVDFDNVKEKVSAITPVPKGVGVLTTATLALNTAKASRYNSVLKI